jgi:hypothetical protein
VYTSAGHVLNLCTHVQDTVNGVKFAKYLTVSGLHCVTVTETTKIVEFVLRMSCTCIIKASDFEHVLNMFKN